MFISHEFTMHICCMTVLLLEVLEEKFKGYINSVVMSSNQNPKQAELAQCIISAFRVFVNWISNLFVFIYKTCLKF